MNIIDQARRAAREKYCWPGGYPLYLLCADGEVLCPDCARREWKLVAQAIRHPGTDTQWEIVAVDVNWEDPDKNMFCDHCGELIECAYGEDLPDEVVTAPQEPLNLVQFVGDFFQMPRSSK